MGKESQKCIVAVVITSDRSVYFNLHSYHPITSVTNPRLLVPWLPTQQFSAGTRHVVLSVGPDIVHQKSF